MKLLDVLHKDSIIYDLNSTDKKGIVEELAASLVKATKIKKEKLIKVLMEREKLGSTGIGGGIGIPHGKLKDLDSVAIAFGLSKKGADFESMDGRPAYIFFLLIAPEDSTGLHLKVLARISRILKNDLFKEKLMNAKSKDEIFSIIKETDEEF
jgi:PTS system nitrogen regulatory IIA component